MGVTLRFGIGLETPSAKDIQEKTGIGPRPGEDEAEFLLYCEEEWKSLGLPGDAFGILTDDGDGDLWFPRSRDGMDLSAELGHYDKFVADSQWSYPGYGSGFRYPLLAAVAKSLEYMLEPSFNLDSVPAEERGGLLAENIEQYRIQIPNDIRSLWNSIDYDSDGHRFVSTVADLLGVPRTLDPYDIVPFLDFFNFGDNQGVIGPVAVERLNRSLDWLEHQTVYKVSPEKGRVEMSAIDWLVGSIHDGYTGRRIPEVFEGLRTIRAQKGAHIFYG